MLKIVNNVAVLFIPAGCVVFAYIMGGPAERRAALWWGLNWLLGTLFVAVNLNSPTLQLIVDGICATGFLPLAVLDVSWLAGAVTLLCAMTFTLEAAYLLEDKKIDVIYMIANNCLTVATALVFLASGLLNLNNRRKRAGEALGPGIPAPTGA
jgi:hypothetical protein